MIPALPIGTEYKVRPKSSLGGVTQGFLLDCLDYNDNPDFSVLSADCLNSEDSMTVTRINLVYEQAAATFLKVFTQHLKSKSLNLWHKNTRQSSRLLQRKTTGLVRLACILNKSIRSIALLTLVNIRTVGNQGAARGNGVAQLAKGIELIQQKNFVAQNLGQAFQFIKATPRNKTNKSKQLGEEVTGLTEGRKESTVDDDKFLSTKVQNVELFGDTFGLLLEDRVKVNIGQGLESLKQLVNTSSKSDKESEKQSTHSSSLKATLSLDIPNPQVLVLPKYHPPGVYSPKLFDKSPSNCVPAPVFRNIQTLYAGTPQSNNRALRPVLVFSTPLRSKSRNQKTLPVSTVCRALRPIPCVHRQLDIGAIQQLQPLAGSFVQLNKTVPMYHVSKDSNYTVVEDMADTPQIFQTGHSPLQNPERRDNPRLKSPEKNQRGSLQFKTKTRLNSPTSPYMQRSAKLFNKSRDGSRQKMIPKGTFLAFQRPQTTHQNIKSSSDTKASSPKRFCNPKKESVTKEISKARVQATFVQSRTSNNPSLFDTRAYFNQ